MWTTCGSSSSLATNVEFCHSEFHFLSDPEIVRNGKLMRTKINFFLLPNLHINEVCLVSLLLILKATE